MRCHLRNGIYETDDFPLPHQSSSVPAGLRVFPSVSGRKFPHGEIFYRKTLRKRRDGRKRDSEGENCDRRSACATRKELSGSPFMPYPGMRPLSSPAVVKALLLPLHCICGLFCPYPRPPVLPALSLRKTAYRNGWRDTDFSGYGGTFRKIHRTFAHRTNNNRITVKRTWLKLKSKIQK